jgi:hypothetical protein|tara:strand:+ start:430 stop:1065 length:636 start_codon:yes stop_codon:yes gene_type:complete
MLKQIDLTNQIFERWLAIEISHKTKTCNYFWLCECICGTRRNVRQDHLIRGTSKSCGCYRKEFNPLQRHGMAGTKFYKTWRRMKDRCNNSSLQYYENYGKRGIKVCDRWMGFENFRDDMYESYLEHIKEYGEKNTSIDRINNNGDYSKENCRWATRSEQQRNKRNNRYLTYKGETKLLVEWAEKLNLNPSSMGGGLSKKWPIEKILRIKSS